MKTTHLSHRVFGYTISELLVGSTVCAVLGRSMLTTVLIGAATYGAALVLMSPALPLS